MDKTKIYVLHSSHLDLYWIAAQEDCLAKGAVIIDNAVNRAKEDPTFYFLIETARFLEYYVAKYPYKLQALKEVFATGQLEIAACYTDRLENHVDGEALVRNSLYGKKIIKKILGIDTKIACHPDIPGFAEQTPQIYKKSGIRYYMSARGIDNGARFNWTGLDGSSIIMYNFPGHYAFFNMEKVISRIEQAKKNIKSDFVLLGCSAGDMGAMGTFITDEGKRISLDGLLKDTLANHPEIEFEMANSIKVLDSMDQNCLESKMGESPSRWGHNGSARNVELFFLDKKSTDTLLEAEKLSTICDILGAHVEYIVDKNPLMHTGGSGGMRRYFDLEIKPDTVKEWIEFGWRLKIITHDHNFGGIDGAQTEFDRMIYQKAAFEIAKNIRELSIKALLEKMNVASDSVAVFNTLNWKRTNIVSFQKPDLYKSGTYVAVDLDGNTVPVFHTNSSWTFLAHDVPSMGYKTFRIEKGNAAMDHIAAVKDTKDFLTVQNLFYNIKIDKATGELVYLYDMETGHNWTDKCNSLVVEAFEDPSLGLNDKIVDKPRIGITSQNVRSVHVHEVGALWTKIEIISEVCDVKVKVLLTLHNIHKRLDIKVSFNWPGIPDVQLTMGLCSRNSSSTINYAVPYGVQEHGKYIDTINMKFSFDEISFELFHRYREVQGWFAVEQDGCGLLVTSNHSACDFKADGVRVVLLSDNRNCGDLDVRFSNYGVHEYEYSLTSYQGTWDKNLSYRTAWESRYPLIAALSDKQDGADLTEHSFVSTGEKGILTVLSKSETLDGAYIARMFNTTSADEELNLSFGIPVRASACINLNETSCTDSLSKLGAFEIKTIQLEKQK